MMPLRLPALIAFGAFGLPVALAALPVYLTVPQQYASRFGVSLAALGVTLLAIRLCDAIADPLIGAWIDRRAQLSQHGRAGPVLLSLPLLAGGYLALLHPPAWAHSWALAWFAASLTVAYAGLSIAAIAHQSWGAALTQAPGERVRVTAAREFFGLLGVIAAAALATAEGATALSAAMLAALAGGAWLLLFRSPRPAIVPTGAHRFSLLVPFRDRRFRWLFALFVINGIASAIPATLFVFFVSDYLGLAAKTGPFLVLYFISAAAALQFWTRLARRTGEARAWLVAMLLAVSAFVWAYALPAGAALPFAVICVAAGAAFGADLALPPALLAAVIAHAGHQGKHEGTYFGAWNWATKMNLALAAGVALPLLDALGYQPGNGGRDGLQALAIGYALLPCALKLVAVCALVRAPLHDL